MKRNRTPDLNFPSLKRLAEEPPAKMMKALRVEWHWLRAALEAGETLKNIQTQLAETGILISYDRLRNYVWRLRREDKRQNRGPQAGKPLSTTPKTGTAPSGQRVRPIAFVTPSRMGPTLMDFIDSLCWTCGRDVLSCRCVGRDWVC